MSNKIEFRVLNEKARDALTYATEGSAAIDLVAALDEGNGAQVIRPLETVRFKTGIALHINDVGMAAMILPRSGLGTKGIILGNTVGLIDSDYQGEIIVALHNRHRVGSYLVKDLDRIAQMIFVPILHPMMVQVKEFSTQTKRGTGGFGSSGS